MIANPILRKEVLSALRTRKAFLMQALFLLMTAVLLWRYWPADGLQDIGSQQPGGYSASWPWGNWRLWRCSPPRSRLRR